MVSSIPAITEPETTGKYLVLFREQALDSGISALRDQTGIKSVARSTDFEKSSVTAEQLAQTDLVAFDNLGVAVCSLDPEQWQSLYAASDESSPIAVIERERVVYAAPVIEVDTGYIAGYRDGVNNALEKLQEQANGAQKIRPLLGIQISNEVSATWGLQATNVVNSRFSGRGIKVAVLDTGLDLTHPDFVGRNINTRSFIPNEEVQDNHGHGTHCIGTASGSLVPAVLPRYGIGYETEIFAGKVLNNQGRGTDGGILAGINWAIANGCQIVSMSLGSPVLPGQQPSGLFEVVADRALRNGTLIIAAAGNESDRRLGVVQPVGHPANCLSIMAVGALDSELQVASFSNGELNPNGGQVDIAAPGIDVYSSYLMPTRYRRLNGTSMATPHVAGIAALYAEATGSTGRALWSLLTQHALRLPLPAVDVGAGLVQAP
ncbi:subtilisin-like serine protease [Cylindrospermum stagnale PCC 7417]|uniref:Subtilisin-like serine protease n=1 Tax=Cylindrospermum stagnale PCC 7417 TaxID=56107 RepID=K9WUY2_9NOST|nr:S8 family serine peptidase [Cylindrospermum stagnale]AFZ24190.1 subtilisin-like serine protease [Cylindrospermum stagnale PCC 7417]